MIFLFKANNFKVYKKPVKLKFINISCALSCVTILEGTSSMCKKIIKNNKNSIVGLAISFKN